MSHLPHLLFPNFRCCISEGYKMSAVVIVLCGGPSLPLHRYSVVIFTFSGPLELWGQNFDLGT